MNHEYNKSDEWLTQPKFVRLVKFVVKPQMHDVFLLNHEYN